MSKVMDQWINHGPPEKQNQQDMCEYKYINKEREREVDFNELAYMIVETFRVC